MRVALLLLPGRFRRAYATDAVDLYRVRRAELEGAGARAAMLARTLLDLLRTAVAERRHSSFVPGHLPEIPARSGDGALTELAYDLRHALRAALARPGYTLVVILTLALGVGANTAIFTVVHGVLMRPLPYDQPETLLRVYGRFDPESGFEFPQFPLSPPEFVDYRDQATTVEAVAAYRTSGVTVTGAASEPERVIAARVSADMMPLLRIDPIVGRWFTVDEDLPGGEAVAVLSHGHWRDRYGADPGVVGATLRVGGTEHTIVGVMPDGLAAPFTRTNLWLPLAIDPADDSTRQSHYIDALARLAPGVDLATAEAEMRTLMAGWQQEYPEIHTGHYLFLTPLLDDIVGDVRPALLTLLAASGFVLLIVCANVGSILLARSEDRSREVAIRSALGARAWRLAQLVLGESLLLSAFGGALGVTLAHFGVRGLLRLDVAGAIPRADTVALDLPVLGFALAVTLVTAVLFSLAPALHTAAIDLRSQLVEGRALAGAGTRRLFVRRLLVASEVALAFMLVMAAGLMIRSFGELVGVDTGFRSDGVLVAGISLPSADYPDDSEVTAFFHELEQRVRALPGVESASVSTAVPMWSGNGRWDFEVEGIGRTMPGGTAFNAAFRTVNPGYFGTIGERLIRGRLIQNSDSADSEPVALVNQTFTRRYFPGEDPIGRRIRVAGDTNAWARIVGIVGDVRDSGLDTDPQPAYYMASSQTAATVQQAFRFMGLVVRTDGDPEALLPDLRRTVRSMDPNLPIIAPQTMASVVGESVARPRFITVLLSLFAVVALVLGASGIYGVLAYSVAQRTREIGIRKALGAPVNDLVRLVVVQGMAPVLAGLAVGAPGALGLGRLMASLLFGVSPTDTLTFVAVATTLSLVAIVACCAPAIRAARMDPLIALRAE